jgi:hypothetical protein
MEKMSYCFQEMCQKLQEEARLFLTESVLVLKGISIRPKEIEVYYYEKGCFEDNSVHQNDLQKNNKNHFYVHRCGTKSSDSYKGGNYAGIDFVVSDTDDIYYTYLIRSALVNEEMVIGPHKVLEAIQKHSNLNYQEIESETIEVVQSNANCDVLFSSRINLGKTVDDEFCECKLRAVLCDELFRESKYPAKEKMVIEFLMEKVQAHCMTNEQASHYAKNNLGYIPSSIKAL